MRKIIIESADIRNMSGDLESVRYNLVYKAKSFFRDNERIACLTKRKDAKKAYKEIIEFIKKHNKIGQGDLFTIIQNNNGEIELIEINF